MKIAVTIIVLVVVLALGLAGIYFVASNGGNKVVAEGKPDSLAIATGPQPKIQFEKTVYDWGTVYQNEKVVHVFKFKNVGQVDLNIDKVKSG